MEEKRQIYPYELIATGIEFLLNTREKKHYSYAPIRSLLVYNLLEKEEGFLPLNREYKPIGLCRYGNYANYDSYNFLLIPKDEVDIEPLNYDGFFTKAYYLFDDTTYPDDVKSKNRYLKLLSEALPKLKTTNDY